MKKLIMSMVIAMIAMFAVPGLAYNPPSAPAEGWYVVDQAGKLSADQMQKLNQKIEHMNKTTKNEYGILLLPDMEGDNIEDVAHATFNAWGVGKKDLDNGVLIVVSIKERKSRIETGKGVGGEIPDLTANKILKENLNPHLKNSDFYGGFDATLTAISSHLESRANQTTTAPRNTGCSVSTADMSAGSILWFIPIVLFFGYLVYRVQARRKETEKWIKEEQAKANAIRTAQQDAQKRQAEERKARLLEEKAHRARLMRSIAEKEAATMAASAAAKASARKVQASMPPIPPRPVTRLKPTTIVTAPAAASVIDNIKKDIDSHKKKEVARQQEADLAEARKREERKRKAAEQIEEAAALAALLRTQQLADEKRRRDQEEADRRSAAADAASAISSIASLFDSGSSSSDSGSGFGGGDSGGGGSSSDW